MKKAIRLDEYIHENGLSESIDTARKEIITGWVSVNGETIRDPLKKISGGEKIDIRRPGGRYASRGGEKLNKALVYFNISVNGKTAADLGSSTGGFTDCLLKNGAAKVYSVDVGYGILAYHLRNDKRVIVKERTNVKSLKHKDFPDKAEFIAVDLSFISILSVFKKIKELFTPAEGVILIKPQFEAGPGEHLKGVVRNKEYHKNILKRVIFSLIKNGMTFRGLTFSPIKGPAGNIEFLLYFEIRVDSPAVFPEKDIDLIINNVIEEAYNIL